MTTRNRTNEQNCSYNNRLCLFGQVADRLKKELKNKRTKSFKLNISGIFSGKFMDISSVLSGIYIAG